MEEKERGDEKKRREGESGGVRGKRVVGSKREREIRELKLSGWKRRVYIILSITIKISDQTI